DACGLQEGADLQGGVVGQLDADVLRRGHVFGEHAVDVHADDPGAFAGVRVAGPAGEALSADQVALQRDAVADAESGHPGSDLHDGAGAFVSQHDGEVEVERLGRGCPFVELPVGAAERRRGHLDDHVAVGGLGVRVVRHVLDAALGGSLDYCLHDRLRSWLKVVVPSWVGQGGGAGPAKRRRMSVGPTWPPLSSSRHPATVARSSVRQIGPAVTNWSVTRSSRTPMAIRAWLEVSPPNTARSRVSPSVAIRPARAPMSDPRWAGSTGPDPM